MTEDGLAKLFDEIMHSARRSNFYNTTDLFDVFMTTCKVPDYAMPILNDAGWTRSVLAGDLQFFTGTTK